MIVNALLIKTVLCVLHFVKDTNNLAHILIASVAPHPELLMQFCFISVWLG